jgi:hypothetical protein
VRHGLLSAERACTASCDLSFDQAARRHARSRRSTSGRVAEDVDVEIDENDLRIDTHARAARAASTST